MACYLLVITIAYCLLIYWVNYRGITKIYFHFLNINHLSIPKSSPSFGIFFCCSLQEFKMLLYAKFNNRLPIIIPKHMPICPLSKYSNSNVVISEFKKANIKDNPKLTAMSNIKGILWNIFFLQGSLWYIITQLKQVVKRTKI